MERILSESQVRDAIAGMDRLPTLPAMVVQVLGTASDPDASALDLARHIAADQSLSAALLRLVNSAYYGFHRRITSVTDAVVILGFVKVRDLALTATAFGAFPGGPTSCDRTHLWRHSLAGAMAAERIARLLRFPLDRGYFAAGLLHDLGKVLLDLFVPHEYAVAVSCAIQKKEAAFVIEGALLGMDHADMGGMLAEHWALPLSFVDAIRHHHKPEESSVDGTLAHVVALADFVAYEAGLGASQETRPPDMPAASIQQLGLSQEQREGLVRELVLARERIDALLGMLDNGHEA